MITRRATAGVLAGAATLAAGLRPSLAADKTVRVGLNLSFTGGDADSANRMKNGAVMAFEESNAAAGANGWKIDLILMDDGTATAGQYDPAQAAINARKMASDKAVVAAIGPQMSGAGKAMAPILSQAGLAIITPSATNPDITDPKFAGQYKPAGKTVFFRTVTTDAFQGPNMANYMLDTLKAKSVFILDDSGAYGVGLADAFEGQAKKRGMTVMGRDRLDPKASDYAAILTRIKSLNPGALYYGGVLQAGVKLAKQAYEIVPGMIKAGGDGMYGPEMLTAVGFPAAEGWYATIASPHVLDDPKMAAWIARYVKRFNAQPDDYTITTYDSAMVILDAVKRVAATNKPMTREAIRDAIASSKVETLQGEVAFDQHGDLRNRVISVFQIKKTDAYPVEDMIHQYSYAGVAPAA